MARGHQPMAGGRNPHPPAGTAITTSTNRLAIVENTKDCLERRTFGGGYYLLFIKGFLGILYGVEL